MPERRFRPGDVLDDYCPHERRITDHAIVAMIDDDIRRTRCVVCDAEHEYKAAKVPTRRKTAPVALFTQVLDGLQGPTARPPSSSPPTLDNPAEPELAAAPEPAIPDAAPPAIEPAPERVEMVASPQLADSGDREEGPVRRSLIRAQFPKTEGQPPAPRAMPEFTVHSLHNRSARNGNHSHRGGGSFRGPMRFGRDNNGQGQQADGAGRPHGRHRRRRGGKKHQ